MMKRTMHKPAAARCVSFQKSAFLFLCIVLLLITSAQVTLADSAQQETDPQANKPSVYIIPDQASSPFQFGVAIKPDLDYRTIEYDALCPLKCPFDDDYHTNRPADVTSVVRVALNEFECFSGLNHWIQGMEKTMYGYSRKLKLTGELNLNKYNSDPMDYIKKVNLKAEIFKSEEKVSASRRNKIQSIISQFNVNKVTWDTMIPIGSPQITFKLGIGDAIVIRSTAGKDSEIGVLIKLTI